MGTLSRTLQPTQKVASYDFVDVSVCVRGEVRMFSHLIRAGEAINKKYGVAYMYFLTGSRCDFTQLPHNQVSKQRAKSLALLCYFELDLSIATSQSMKWWREVPKVAKQGKKPKEGK